MSSVATDTATTLHAKQNPVVMTNRSETAQAVPRPFSLRGFTSMLLMICMFGLLLTGVILYIAPRGRFANWNDWTAIGLDRYQWISLHINASLLFVVLAAIHLFMNWSRLVGYVKRKSQLRINMKRELAAALAITFTLTLATILDLNPISFPMQLRGEIRDTWERPPATPTDVSLDRTNQIARTR